MPLISKLKKTMKTRKPYQRKRRVYRKAKYNSNNVVGGPNTCKVIETLPSLQMNLNTPYLITKVGITGTRAPAIAEQFGLYRIASIKFTHRPLFDTFSSSLPGVGNAPNSVPTLYWKMNRYGDNPAGFDGDYMRALGAKPFRLDDKQVTFRYKPNILLAQDNGGGVPTTSQIKMTPWLSTDNAPQDQAFVISTAEHYGHTLFIEGGGAGNAQGPVCTMDVQVVYEFKNPRSVVPDAVDARPVAALTL